MGVTFDLRTLDRSPVPESRKNTLSVIIDRPVAQVFEFATNPKCTPLWVDGIVREERSEEPTRLGTKYWNVNKQGKWTSYSIVDFEDSKVVEFEIEGRYHCRYTLEELPVGKTKLTYSEWSMEGDLEEPFQQDALNRFKEVMESQSPIAPFLRKVDEQIEKETEEEELFGEPVDPKDLNPHILEDIERMEREGKFYTFRNREELKRILDKKREELEGVDAEDPTSSAQQSNHGEG